MDIDTSKFEGHTGGDWRYEDGYISCNPIGGATLFLIAQVRGHGHLQYLGEHEAERIQDANGELLAAAPRLLAENARLREELAEVRTVRPEAREAMDRLTRHHSNEAGLAGIFENTIELAAHNAALADLATVRRALGMEADHE